MVYLKAFGAGFVATLNFHPAVLALLPKQSSEASA
jgi:hypothetical protein